MSHEQRSAPVQPPSWWGNCPGTTLASHLYAVIVLGGCRVCGQPGAA